MSENKQFVEIDDGLDFSIKHIESGEEFYDCESVVDLLNEQQDTIHELQDTVYDELEKALKVLEEIYEDYPKNNVHHLHSRLKGLLEELDE